MKFSPTKFNRLINNLGQTVEWRKADKCPCRSEDGVPVTNCAHCRGSGYIWASPVTCVLAQSGQKVQRVWANFGLWEDGDTVVTLPSDSAAYAMGEFDRVKMMNSTIPFSITMDHAAIDYIPFSVAYIDRTFWINDQDNIVEGTIPTISANILTWVSAPPIGEQITISGRKHPEYFSVGEFPQDRAHHGGLTLPRRVVLRSFDLYGKST